jgi:hypothetical protein
MLLRIDGSPHRWFPEERWHDLLVIQSSPPDLGPRGWLDRFPSLGSQPELAAAIAVTPFSGSSPAPSALRSRRQTGATRPLAPRLWRAYAACIFGDWAQRRERRWHLDSRNSTSECHRQFLGWRFWTGQYWPINRHILQPRCAYAVSGNTVEPNRFGLQRGVDYDPSNAP